MKTSHLLLAGLVLLTLASCSVHTEITLDTATRGTAVTRVRMAPLLREYLGDLAEVQGAEITEESSFFDVPALIDAFRENPGVDLTGLSQDTPEAMEIVLGFENIEEIFPREIEQSGGRVVRSETRGDETRLFIRINRGNAASVIDMVPFGDDPISETITGTFQSEGSVEELKEMLAWSFEEYAPADEVEAIIDTSSITLRFILPGTLISVEGGEVASYNTAEFTIPLIRFFHLDPPIEYTIVYRN